MTNLATKAVIRIRSIGGFLDLSCGSGSKRGKNCFKKSPTFDIFFTKNGLKQEIKLTQFSWRWINLIYFLYIFFFSYHYIFWESEFERIRIIVEVLDPDPDGAQWGSSIRIQIIAFLQQWMKVYWTCTVGHHFQWIFIETVTFFYFAQHIFVNTELFWEPH